MTTPEHPPIGADKAAEIRGSVVRAISDQKFSLEVAHEMADNDPEYAREAARIAADLFPDNQEMRDIFLSGTELRFLQQRQVAEAETLEALEAGILDGDPEPAPRLKRRWIGGRVALLAIGLFARPKKPSGGVV